MIRKSLVVILLVLLNFNTHSQSIMGLQSNSEIDTHIDEVPVKSTLRDIDALKIGIILPFVNKSQSRSARFVEYYEGFLLALQDRKSKGLHANVYVFDMGSEDGTVKLNSLLDTYEMKNLDLIIGGISTDQINALAYFANRENIKYVIPFPTKEDATSKGNQVFQIHQPQALLSHDVAQVFVSMFNSANVIYLSDPSDENPKKELISYLDYEQSQLGIRPQSIIVNDELKANLSLALDQNRRNVIIATTGSRQLLQNLFPILSVIKEENPDLYISLFGHSEWQTYTQFFPDFNSNDTYIYSPFFLSNNDARTQKLESDYKDWYNDKFMINTFPKYAVLGYDTGMYFLSGLMQYGRDFDPLLNRVYVTELQSPFSFGKEKDDEGYMNNGFYIIHYNLDGSIDKIKYGK